MHIIYCVGIRALNLYLFVYETFSYKQSSCAKCKLSVRSYYMHLKDPLNDHELQDLTHHVYS